MRARPWLVLAVAACLAIAVLGDGHDDDGSVASDSSHDDSHDDGHGDDGHDSSSHAHGGEHANHAAPLILLVVALFFGVLAKTLLAKSKIPYTVLLLLAGVAVGWGVDYEGADDKKPLHRSVRAWDRVNPHLLMYLFLPVLIFESAFSVDVHTLFRELFQFTWAASLMLGAILSATDPVAVVALLKSSACRLGTLIEGESLFNDGTAIVVFNVFFHELRDRGNGGGIDGGEVAVYFLRLAGGGVLLGVLVGGATVLGLSYIYDDGLSEITLTIVAAMGTFLIAEMITVDGQALTSGVLAAARVDSGLQARRVSATLHVIRFVVLLVAWPLLRRMGYGMDWKFGVALWWGALRGAVGLTLALIVEEDHASRDSASAEAEFVAVGRELSLASDDHAAPRDDDRFLVDCDWATCLRYLPVHDAETYRTRLAATEAGAAPLMAKRWHGYAKAFGGPNAADADEREAAAAPRERRARARRRRRGRRRPGARRARRRGRRGALRHGAAAPRARCSTASRRAAAWASAAARRGSPRAPILDRLFRANLAYAFDVASCYAGHVGRRRGARRRRLLTADAAGAELAEEAEQASRWLDEYLGAFPEVARSVTTEAAAGVVLARETEDVLERVHAGELGSREERVLRAALAASAARLDFGRTAIPPPTALAKLKNLPGLAIFDRLHGLGPSRALARRPAYGRDALRRRVVVPRAPGEARCLRAPDAPRPRRARWRRSVFAALAPPRVAGGRRPSSRRRPRRPTSSRRSARGGPAGLEPRGDARALAYVADRLTQVFEFPNDATKGLMERTPALRDALLAAAGRDFSPEIAALAGRGDVVARGSFAGDDPALGPQPCGGCGLVGKAGAARARAHRLAAGRRAGPEEERRNRAGDGLGRGDDAGEDRGADERERRAADADGFVVLRERSSRKARRSGRTAARSGAHDARSPGSTHMAVSVARAAPGASSASTQSAATAAVESHAVTSGPVAVAPSDALDAGS
ncbi:potassium:proton antiporter [Aureococcus anophagefferens]|nr:potassium:proton antiporter [Aureococcus anophagefferens]